MIENLPLPTDTTPGVIWVNLLDSEKEKMIIALKQIFDPEIPKSIYDIGLIYKIEKTEEQMEVFMTLTSPTCPEADVLPDKVCNVLKPEFDNVKINLIWNPLWSIERIPLSVQLELGLI